MLKQAKAVFALMAGLSLVLLGSGAAQAADNWAGTWKLNLAKSKYSPGPAPKSNVARLEASDGGIKAVSDGVGPDDKPTHTEFAAKFDGKDYPYKGSAAFDTITVKRIDDNTYEASLKGKGKATMTSRNVVSKDGKTRTQTQTGTDAQGKAINNTIVYDRQ